MEAAHNFESERKAGLWGPRIVPGGGTGQKEVALLQRELVFLKEYRAPHVIVGMCKRRYMWEREFRSVRFRLFRVRLGFPFLGLLRPDFPPQFLMPKAPMKRGV